MVDVPRRGRRPARGNRAVSVVTQASGEASVTVMVYAWLIFMLPHSIVAMSISTTYFTRLAEEVAAGRLDRVGPNLDESIRAIALFGFGFTAAIGAASVPSPACSRPIPTVLSRWRGCCAATSSRSCRSGCC
jgi:hypothetical protein